MTTEPNWMIMQQLDAIIDGADDTVSPEQIQIMKRLKTASNVLIKRLNKAKRAGLDMDNAIEQSRENVSRIDKFLREYGN